MPKTAKTCSKIQEYTQIFDYNFETVEENSNLKETWTRVIVSLHFWRILLERLGDSWDPVTPLGAVHKVCHAPEGEGVWESVTVCGRGRGGEDHVTSHFPFFHNSQFYVLFYILSCIIQIYAATITFRVLRNQTCKGISWFIRNTQYGLFHCFKNCSNDYSYLKQSPCSIFAC